MIIKRQETKITATSAIDSDIRPISDLRNKFAEIADYVQSGRPVIFTRNGYGCMVAMSYETYKHLNDPVMSELNRADALYENDPRHYTRAQSLKILKERRDARRKEGPARAESLRWTLRQVITESGTQEGKA